MGISIYLDAEARCKEETEPMPVQSFCLMEEDYFDWTQTDSDETNLLKGLQV